MVLNLSLLWLLSVVVFFSERFGDPNGVLLGQVLFCPSGGLGGSKVKVWSLLQLRAGLLCWL